MTATTEKVRELLGTRLTELDEEKTRIERAMETLNGATPSAKPRVRRRRRGGTRADQAVALIEKAADGISASEIAKAMKIKPNYLYRLLGDLESEGRVKKSGRTYYPAG